MARPKRTVEQEWFDVFADWPLAEQISALRILEEINRQGRRGRLPKNGGEQRTLLDETPNAATGEGL